jgi:lipoprotein-anchoring transpeptidase ErfK/SrfK
MSDGSETFSADLYGEHQGRHPSMDDLKTHLAVQVIDKLVDVIAERPGTASVDYHGRTRKVAEHGKIFDEVSDEEITFGPDGSDTHAGRWKGWTTAHITAKFHVESI